MKARLLRLGNQLSESYWFVPTLMAVAALLLATIMVWIDVRFGADWMSGVPWLYASRPDGARSLLSSIGGSMIGVAGTTFSVTIAAVVYASGQYGPRLLSNFMSDRGNQVTLGTFIATFLYSLIVVRTIHNAEDGQPAFVPQLAVLIGVLLVLSSIAVLIYFIHHVPSRIHINSVIERVGTRLIEEIDKRFPVFVGAPLEASDDDPRVPAALRPGASEAGRAGVVAEDTGYIQLIDQERLIETAREHDLVLRLHYQPGDFARVGNVLLEACPPGAVDDDAADDLRAAFAFSARRTALQDLRFLIDELVEIAARALSPGVNDPFTANSCLDWLGAAIADFARRNLPSPLRGDKDGALRVVTYPQSFADVVDRAFGALAQYASADMIAGRRFLATLGDVALACEAPSRVAVLARQTEAFRELADGNLSGANRAAVVDRADALARILADPGYKALLRDRQGWLGGSA